MSEKADKIDPFDQVFLEEYTPLVKRIAHHLVSKLPSHIQLEDLIQAGMIGLLEAARKFDDTKGASFATYAGIRIRGSILDEVRKGDWTPRSVHRNSRRVSQATRDVENESGRSATVQEVANKLGVSLDEYYSYVYDSNHSRIFAFEDLGLNEAIFTNTHTMMPNPIEGVQKEDFISNLSAELAKLPEREKLVIALYYDEELNLREVGEILGVSESRVSQIHSQAMARLQGRMKAWRN